jgi:hypothetical protein
MLMYADVCRWGWLGDEGRAFRRVLLGGSVYAKRPLGLEWRR